MVLRVDKLARRTSESNHPEAQRFRKVPIWIFNVINGFLLPICNLSSWKDIKILALIIVPFNVMHNNCSFLSRRNFCLENTTSELFKVLKRIDENYAYLWSLCSVGFNLIDVLEAGNSSVASFGRAALLSFDKVADWIRWNLLSPLWSVTVLRVWRKCMIISILPDGLMPRWGEFAFSSMRGLLSVM